MLICIFFFIVSLTVLMLGTIAFNKERIFPPKTPFKGKKPFVSILIAARNESGNIENLCRSLDQLSYPKNGFEVLIGNDDSADDTLKLLKKHAPSNAVVLNFDQPNSGAYGKLRVLKKLAKQAKGEFLLYTDADVELNLNWIQGMLYEINDAPQMQMGVTVVKGGRWFDELQNIDWLINQSVISWVSCHLRPVTAWGNNMCIDTQSFRAVGGYEGIEFSIIEDVDLMRKVENQKGQIWVNASPESIVFTKPCPNFVGLLSQRQRWLSAVRGLHWSLKFGLLIKMLFLPMVMLLAWSNPWFLTLIPLKAMMLYFIMRHVARKIDQPLFFEPFLFFEFYEFAVYFMTFVMYLLPVKVKWKDRFY